MDVNLIEIDEPTPVRWMQNFKVDFNDSVYVVQVLTDDEGVEETNMNFWLDYTTEELDYDKVPVEVRDFVVEMTFNPSNGKKI